MAIVARDREWTRAISRRIGSATDRPLAGAVRGWEAHTGKLSSTTADGSFTADDGIIVRVRATGRF